MNRAAILSTASSVLLALASPHASAQSFSAVVSEGDSVTGVGLVTRIDNVAVNDSSNYLVEVDTDNPDTDADGAIVGPSGAVLIENQSLPLPVGALLDSFDAVNLNASGDSGFNFFLDGTSGSSDDSGVYFNTTLLIQESDISAAPELSAGTPYIGFFEVKLNGPGDALVMASVDDPAISSTVDRALVLLDLDASGTVLSESAVYKEGDAPASLLGDAITDFETGPHNYAFNDAGQIAYIVDCESNFGGNNAVFRDDELIAREGDPSPIPGRAWGSLSGRSVALNNNGTLLWRGDLDGASTDDDVIVLTNTAGTNQILARQGDTMATSMGVFQITDFGGSTPIGLSDDGDTLYFVDLDADSDFDELLVWNGQILVQEGVTQVGGVTIDSIGSGVTDLFSLSPSGDYLIFECTLVGGINTAVLVDLTVAPLGGPFCDASDAALAACPCGNPGSPTSGCEIAQGTGGVHLSVLTQQTTPQNRATLVGNGFPTGSTPSAVIIRAPMLDAGSPAVFGDGLRCVGLPVVRLGSAIAADGTSRHTFGHGAVAGAGTFFYQAWFRNTPMSFCDPTAAFNLSNGHSLVW